MRKIAFILMGSLYLASCSSSIFRGSVKESPYIYYLDDTPNVHYTEEQARRDVEESSAGGFSCEKIKKVPVTALQYQGVMYKFGGNTPEGFDCSGLSSYVYSQNGIQIPRSASQQYAKLNPIKIPKKGDLIFFKINNSSIVSHVGIYLGDNKMIHAPHEGKPVMVVSVKNDYWKKTYAGARTVCEN